jgi:hypothetical protein
MRAEAFEFASDFFDMRQVCAENLSASISRRVQSSSSGGALARFVAFQPAIPRMNFAGSHHAAFR